MQAYDVTDNQFEISGIKENNDIYLKGVLDTE